MVRFHQQARTQYTGFRPEPSFPLRDCVLLGNGCTETNLRLLADLAPSLRRKDTEFNSRQAYTTVVGREARR